MSFFTGTPGQYEQKSIYGKEQMPLYQQRINAAQRQGAGGAFGSAADFYRQQLANQDPYAMYNELSAPHIREFNEQIVPGLAEQFAGMGSGGLDSSGFRNAAVGAGADLSERLGAIRAQLRQQGIQNQFNAAQGLEGIGQGGLSQSYENLYRERTPGFLEGISNVAGTAAGAYLGSNFYNPFEKKEPNEPLKSPNEIKKGSSSVYGNPSREQIQNWKPSQGPIIGRGY